MRVLMVCLGNICRSPLAEALFNKLAENEGLPWHADSAGTSDFHQGEGPHEGSVLVARKSGLDIRAQRSRPFVKSDFALYDRIIAMDRSVERDLSAKATTQADRKKIEILLTYYPEGGLKDVPDPYFTKGFDQVFELIENACAAMIARWKQAGANQEA